MAKARGPKIVSHAARVTRQAMAEKVTKLVERSYPGLALNTAFARIEASTGISQSSLQRITEGQIGPSIDTLANLAYHLGSTVAEIVATQPGGDLGGSKPGRKKPDPTQVAAT